MIQKSYKTSPKKILGQIKKRRQTINITESQYNLRKNMKSPQTQKKQYYFIKDIKLSHKFNKKSKVMYTEAKKSERLNSLTPNETDSTPKKLFFYHIESSQQRQKCSGKIHSISLVDTARKLNPNKKTQQALFVVKQQKDKQGCKKVMSSTKFSSRNYGKPSRLQSGKLQDSNEAQESVQMKSSKKIQSKNYQNCSNESGNDSQSQLKTSKRMDDTIYHTESTGNAVCKQKHQSNSRTLRINRNSRSSNYDNRKEEDPKKRIKNQVSSRNNTRSQKGIKPPRLNAVSTPQSVLNERKFQVMFSKCSSILERYNIQLQKMKGQNQSLRRENQQLKCSLSPTG